MQGFLMIKLLSLTKLSDRQNAASYPFKQANVGPSSLALTLFPELRLKALSSNDNYDIQGPLCIFVSCEGSKSSRTESTEKTACRRYGSKLEKNHLRPTRPDLYLFPPFPCADFFSQRPTCGACLTGSTGRWGSPTVSGPAPLCPPSLRPLPLRAQAHHAGLGRRSPCCALPRTAGICRRPIGTRESRRVLSRSV
jgi:hypothetical protein